MFDALVHYDSQVAVALNSFNLATTGGYFLRREKRLSFS